MGGQGRQDFGTHPPKMLGTPIWPDVRVRGPRMKNPSAIPAVLYWFSITLDQIPALQDVNRIYCEQKNGLNNIVQGKRNKQHQELRSLFAFEVKQIITTPSTLHYPTPSCHFLPSQFAKICDISKPCCNFFRCLSRNTYDLLTTYKIQSTCTIGVFLLYSNKMQ